MKHWCYYANVVRYLEKLEANAVKKKQRGAYLVWRDDEGPHMIAGPDIYWHRGAGPMPDLAGLNISIRSASAARVSKRSAAAVLSTPEKANKRRTPFPKPAQTCSPKQQRRGRKSALTYRPRRARTEVRARVPAAESAYSRPRHPHALSNSRAEKFPLFPVDRCLAEISVTPRLAGRRKKIEGILSS